MIPGKSSINHINKEGLKQFVHDANGFLMDIRVPEAFAEKHIPGAINHCIYEVVFLDSVRETDLLLKNWAM